MAFKKLTNLARARNVNFALFSVFIFGWSGCTMADDTGKNDQANLSLVSLSGVFVGRGVVCERFKLDDGETISLSGDYRVTGIDVPAKLNGRWAQISKCQQGREFRVLSQED